MQIASAFPAFLVAAYAFYFAVFHTLSNMVLSDPLLYDVHARFWLQPNLLAFTLAGVGATTVAQAMVNRLGKPVASAVFVAPSAAGSSQRIHGGPVLLVPAAALAVLGAVGIKYQYSRHLFKMDNSDNIVMNRYGRALLEPLPQGAILITGYDMQWTATRYLQTCEGLRRDVTLLNSAVMSFSWFAAQRHLYPAVSWPGTHLVGHLTPPHAAGGFSLADFFAANSAVDGGAALMRSYDVDPPHPDFKPRNTVNTPSLVLRNHSSGVSPYEPAQPQPRHGGVYFTGTPLFRDTAHSEQFDFVPFGIVDKVVPKYVGARKRLTSGRNITKVDPLSDVRHRVGHRRASSGTDAEAREGRAAWQVVTSVYAPVPPTAKYDAYTWEHATRIDFFSKAVSYASWLLDWAVQPPSQAQLLQLRTKQSPSAGASGAEEPRDLASVLRAAAILEDAMAHQLEDNVTVLPSTFKNLGLAYVKLVRSQQRLPAEDPWPVIPQHEELSPQEKDEAVFRVAASQRVLETWGQFITTPEAKADAGYQTIVQVVNILRTASLKGK